MLTIYSEDHRLQHGKVKLTGGHFIPVVEKPERAETILASINGPACPLDRCGSVRDGA